MQYQLSVKNILMDKVPDHEQNVCTYTNHTNLTNQTEYDDAVMVLYDYKCRFEKHAPMRSIGHTIVNSYVVDITNFTYTNDESAVFKVVYVHQSRKDFAPSFYLPPSWAVFFHFFR